MATFLESFQIQSPELGSTLKIDLVEGLDSQHIDFIQNEWRPILKKQRNLALLQFFLLPIRKRTYEAKIEKLATYGASDEHWEWGDKWKYAATNKKQVFALLNGGEPEAAMIVHFENNARIANKSNDPRIAYIEYLAVAPWNRREIQDPRRLAGLGRTLLGKAIRLSQERGFDGRCGLHSLKSAESFYHQLGMTDLGPDATAQGLRYFEFDADCASKFGSEIHS